MHTVVQRISAGSAQGREADGAGDFPPVRRGAEALPKTLTSQWVLPYTALAHLIYHLQLTPEWDQRLQGYDNAQFEKGGCPEAVGRSYSKTSSERGMGKRILNCLMILPPIQ